MSKLTTPVHIELKDIELELVNIQCGFRLHNDVAGEEEFEKHMRNSHRIDIGIVRPSFTRSADCKPYKSLDKIKSLPKPLTLTIVQTWAEDTFTEFREHGLVDNVDDIKHMNTNPSYGRIIWDLLRSVMTNAQAAEVQSFLKTRRYDVTHNKSYPIGTLLEALKKLCPKDNLFQTIKTIFNKKD